jgi:tetratricopeptide (TPR) repeat protein
MILPVDKILPMQKIISAWRVPVLAVLGFFVCASAASAADDPAREQLQTCLKKASDMPDLAAADANKWMKQGGGDAALLCRAYAYFHGNEFAKSAEDFAQLAASRKDAKRGSLLHAQAGLAWMRAEKYKKAEDEYGKALKLEPEDPDIWVDRATERGANQKYWDALDDLNQALKIMPDMPEALRLRGDVWFKLGNGQKAQDDFHRAAEISAEDDAAAAKAVPPTVAPKKNP